MPERAGSAMRRDKLSLTDQTFEAAQAWSVNSCGVGARSAELGAGEIGVRILLVGGSGFIGRFVVRDLLAGGHEIAVFHRGLAGELPAAVQRIIGDQAEIERCRAAFERFAPDVVVDFILSNGRQARALAATFRGIAGRVVAIGSQDVYRAFGILHGSEPGPLQGLPITEDSDLRTRPQPYGPELLKKLRETLTWLDGEEYEKISVELALRGDSELPATILRLPMVYGPGDPLHRFFPAVRRIDDDRPAILIQDDAASWRGPRGYVENVAAGVALAAASPAASGRVYNLGEPYAFSEYEWTEKIGRAAGWPGQVIAIAKDCTPPHLRVSYRNEQDWIVSTQRIRDELGFAEPISEDLALARTIDWEREHPPAQIDPGQFNYAAEDAAILALHGTAPGYSA